MRKRRKIITDDGSVSFVDEDLEESFHSTFGAISESQHIFIESALTFRSDLSHIHVLEMGWGTGLNALLSWLWQRENHKQVSYTAVEKYPLLKEEFQQLNYHKLLSGISENELLRLHNSPWEQMQKLEENFLFQKHKADILDFPLPPNNFDVIYFDAFSPGKQTELWSEEVFQTIFIAAKAGAVLTSYSVSGQVRRALSAVGFVVEKIPGPKGKREITRAIKP